MRRSSQEQREQRVIRVLVSSTFRDMKEEREILVKMAFPQIRKTFRRTTFRSACGPGQGEGINGDSRRGE
jgi:hypothetical protein